MPESNLMAKPNICERPRLCCFGQVKTKTFLIYSFVRELVKQIHTCRRGEGQEPVDGRSKMNITAIPNGGISGKDFQPTVLHRG